MADRVPAERAREWTHLEPLQDVGPEWTRDSARWGPKPHSRRAAHPAWRVRRRVEALPAELKRQEPAGRSRRSSRCNGLGLPVPDQQKITHASQALGPPLQPRELGLPKPSARIDPQ